MRICRVWCDEEEVVVTEDGAGAGDVAAGCWEVLAGAGIREHHHSHLYER